VLPTVDELAELITNHVPGLREGGGYDVIALATLLAASLWQVANPPPILSALEPKIQQWQTPGRLRADAKTHAHHVHPRLRQRASLALPERLVRGMTGAIRMWFRFGGDGGGFTAVPGRVGSAAAERSCARGPWRGSG
jgi:hypothetical protein